MEYYKYFLICVLGLAALTIIIFSLKSGKPFRTLLFNAFISLCIMTIINLTEKYSGAYIPVNVFTVSGVAALGIPAICGFLILNVIFI